jgi:hypothetical protein
MLYTELHSQPKVIRDNSKRSGSSGEEELLKTLEKYEIQM